MHAFLRGRLRFLDIAAVIEETLDTVPTEGLESFESLMVADGQARVVAAQIASDRSR